MNALIHSLTVPAQFVRKLRSDAQMEFVVATDSLAHCSWDDGEPVVREALAAVNGLAGVLDALGWEDADPEEDRTIESPYLAQVLSYSLLASTEGLGDVPEGLRDVPRDQLEQRIAYLAWITEHAPEAVAA